VLDAPGLLSDRLQLLLVDETDLQDPVTVHAGTPAGLGEVELGRFDAGEERDYRLTVALPDGGMPGSDITGDNRFQGASLSLGLHWRAAPGRCGDPAPDPDRRPASTAASRRVKGTKVRRPLSLRGLGNKPAKVKVTIKAGDRRTYTATRSYRPCARR
jgi:hypothetical protein